MYSVCTIDVIPMLLVIDMRSLFNVRNNNDSYYYIIE